MNLKEIFRRSNLILRDIFDDDELNIFETTAENIEEWDSLPY